MLSIQQAADGITVIVCTRQRSQAHHLKNSIIMDKTTKSQAIKLHYICSNPIKNGAADFGTICPQ